MHTKAPPHPSLLPLSLALSPQGKGKGKGGGFLSDPGLPSRGKQMRRKRYGQTRWKGHQAVVNQRKMHAYFSDGERVALAKERLKNQELAEENRMGSGRLV
jgi:hypothetical protein